MRFILTALLMFLGKTEDGAGQQHFIYFEHSLKVPFYVRVGEDVHRSTAEGHLLLSPVADSALTFFIGFPGSRIEEQRFTVAANGQDRGFRLQRDNGSWVLYDLIESRVLTPDLERMQTGRMGEKIKTDSYSLLMAEVVDDSAVLFAGGVKTADSVVKRGTAGGVMDSLQRVAARKENVGAGADVALKALDTAARKKGSPPVSDTGRVGQRQPMQVSDSSNVVKAGGEVDSVTRKVPAVAMDSSRALPFTRPDVFKLEEENTAEGRQYIYVDRTGMLSDTIRFVIPRL